MLKKIGITFGCFIPMHTGHINLIQQALNDNDQVIITVCGYDSDRGQDFIDFQTRIALVNKIFDKQPNVKVISIDDKKINLTGTFSIQAWTIWGNELFKNAGLDPDHNNYNWYTGETDYIQKLSLIYPKHRFIKLDRDMINISGTEIRSNPKEYASQIHPVFQEYLRTKKIL